MYQGQKLAHLMFLELLGPIVYDKRECGEGGNEGEMKAMINKEGKMRKKKKIKNKYSFSLSLMCTLIHTQVLNYL
jgi:hypothetical protein